MWEATQASAQSQHRSFSFFLQAAAGHLENMLCPAEDEPGAAQLLQAQGGVARQAPERVARVRYSQSGQLLACQSAGKLLELFRCGRGVCRLQPECSLVKHP